MRKPIGASALIVLGLLQSTGSSSAQDRVLDPWLTHARTVALAFDTGFDFTLNPPSPDDRVALDAVRGQLERSGRFSVVDNRRAADLVIAIRVRWASDGSTRAFRRDGLTFRSVGRTKADVLSVYEARYPQPGVALWRGALVEGLSGDRPPLLASFLGDVERFPRRR
jgi:hypothetical protein